MTRDRFPRIVRAVNDASWAIMPATLETILGLIEMRASGEKLTPEEIDARISGGPGKGGDTGRVGGVAVLNIAGPIIPRATLFSDVSGGTSMEGFANEFAAAMDDPDVEAILLDVNSPGGLVDLVPETAAAMRERRGEKPVVAVANTLMASAAYWIGAQADSVYVTPSGNVGSIGVFGTHVDISGAQEKAGVKTTMISAGKFKTEGNAFEPLTEEAAAAMQARVSAAYDLFVADVAAGRSVAEATVRGGYGEGRALDAKAALSAGLVDGIQTFDATLRGLLRSAAKARGARAAVVVPATAASSTANLTDGSATFTQPAVPATPNADRVAAFVEQADELLELAAELIEAGRPLTAAKRERMLALQERLRELLAVQGVADTGDALTADHEFALLELDGRFRESTD